MSRRPSLFLMMSLVAMAGCSSPESKTETPAPAVAPAEQTPASSSGAPSAEPKRYDLKGKIVAVDKEAMRVTVDHEAIEGFMGAMTMVYPVKEVQQLQNLQPGQAVRAKVVSSGTDYWLENISAVR